MPSAAIASTLTYDAGQSITKYPAFYAWVEGLEWTNVPAKSTPAPRSYKRGSKEVQLDLFKEVFNA